MKQMGEGWETKATVVWNGCLFGWNWFEVVYEVKHVVLIISVFVFYVTSLDVLILFYFGKDFMAHKKGLDCVYLP